MAVTLIVNLTLIGLHHVSVPGSQRWVHTSCLEKWRLTSRKPFAETRCGICQYDYKFRNSGYVNTCIDNICHRLANNQAKWFLFNEILIITLTIICDYLIPYMYF